MVYMMIYCRCHLLSTHFIFSCQIPNELRSSWTYFLRHTCDRFRNRYWKLWQSFRNKTFPLLDGNLGLHRFCENYASFIFKKRNTTVLVWFCRDSGIYNPLMANPCYAQTFRRGRGETWWLHLSFRFLTAVHPSFPSPEIRRWKLDCSWTRLQILDCSPTPSLEPYRFQAVKF